MVRPFGGEAAAFVPQGAHRPQRLDVARLYAGIPESYRPRVRSLQLFTRVDSTNAELRRQLRFGIGPGTVCVADAQTGGSGRGGRHWASPPGHNVYVSVLERAPADPRLRGRLPLWVGVALAECLQRQGAEAVRLKWPNDLLWRGGKLGGVLVEGVSLREGPGAIVGVGLNLWLPEGIRRRLGRPVADLREVFGGRPADRMLWVSRVIAAVLEAATLARCASGDALVARWRALDALRGRVIALPPGSGGRPGLRGTVEGIDREGRLCVTAGGVTMRLTTLEDRWIVDR